MLLDDCMFNLLGQDLMTGRRKLKVLNVKKAFIHSGVTNASGKIANKTLTTINIFLRIVC